MVAFVLFVFVLESWHGIECVQGPSLTMANWSPRPKHLTHTFDWGTLAFWTRSKVKKQRKKSTEHRLVVYVQFIWVNWFSLFHYYSFQYEMPKSENVFRWKEMVEADMWFKPTWNECKWMVQILPLLLALHWQLAAAFPSWSYVGICVCACICICICASICIFIRACICICICACIRSSLASSQLMANNGFPEKAIIVHSWLQRRNDNWCHRFLPAGHWFFLWTRNLGHWFFLWTANLGHWFFLWTRNPGHWFFLWTAILVIYSILVPWTRNPGHWFFPILLQLKGQFCLAKFLEIDWFFTVH